MSAPILHVRNRAEASGTLTSTGAAADKPITRVIDLDIGLPWVDSAAAGTRRVTHDAGVGNQSTVSGYAVLGGHNLHSLGVATTLESSPDLSAWTVRDTVTPGSGAAFRRTIASLAARGWRLGWASPGVAPSLTEWILSDPLTLPSGPQEPSLVTGPRGNVVVHESVGGYEWAYRRGAARWEATYLIRDLTEDQKAALETAFADAQEGARPFLLEDADGILRWVRWVSDGGLLPFQAVPVLKWDVPLRFREVL